jgi:ABC-type polysaccharide/polyol phosphate export permease
MAAHLPEAIPRSSGLAASLAIQRRVIGALMLREIITRYGRHNIGILWLVFEPMLFTLGVAALWHVAKMHTVTAVPVIAFAVTGYSSVLLWRNVSNRCAKAIEPNLSLMYHRNVKVLDIFLSRTFLEIAGATASVALLTALFAFAGVMSWPADPAKAMAGWLMLCWFSLALGLMVGALSERSEVFERVWHIFTYLMFPLSGAVFMVHWLPAAAQDVVLWLPMVHGVELVRSGYFGGVVTTYEQPSFMAVINALMTLVGLALVRHTGRNVRPE